VRNVERRVVLGGLGLALAVPACGSGSGGAGSVSLAQACADLATSECNQRQACDPRGFAQVFADVTTCVARTQLPCPTLSQAPGSGYQPAAIEACAKALASATCADVGNDIGLAACQIRGTLPPGAACADDSQCAGAENYCRLSGSCGVCAPRKGVSDPNNPLSFGDCAGNDGCQDGLVCNLTLCAATVAPGGACSLTAPCTWGYACISGTCAVPMLSAGAACDYNASACDPTQGLVCPQAGMCTVLPTATLGQTCGLDATTGLVTSCVGGSVCNVTSGNYLGTCVTPLADGDACDAMSYLYDQCQPPAACTGGFCNLPDPLACTPSDGGAPNAGG
jgi:hypothetical protein